MVVINMTSGHAVGELLPHNVVQLIINISGHDIIYDINFPV